MDVEQRAREFLAAEWEKCGDVGQNVATGIRAGASLPLDLPAIRAIIAALTPPEGSDQSLLELAATFETCIPFLPSAGQRNIGKAVAQLRHMAMGYVLAPVIPAYEMAKALADTAGCNLAHAALAYRDALAARPEVKP